MRFAIKTWRGYLLLAVAIAGIFSSLALSPVADFGWKCQHITADTLVRTGRGVVHTVTLEPAGGAGAVALWDNTSATGTILWRSTIDTTTLPVSILLDAEFTTGLYLDFQTQTCDLTITYF